MAEEQQAATRPDAPNLTTTIPLKRSLEDEHTPVVSSPLNPDAKARPTPPRPVVREQREKKDSFKKRESLAGSSIKRDATVETKPKGKGKTATFAPPGQNSPVRYNHKLPREPWAYVNKDPVMVPREGQPIYAPNGIELKRPFEHIENKNKFHYDHCVADPRFHSSRYWRRTDLRPYGARMSFEDSDKWFFFDDSAKIVTNERGWRSARANVFAREGRLYYEVKILRGIPADAPQNPQEYNPSNHKPTPHVRMGWARREAPIDTPVGYDGYSYGLSDARMQTMHRSRMGRFLDDGQDPLPGKKSKTQSKSSKSRDTGAAAPAVVGFEANDSLREGDVVGLEINLPSLVFHRKVADGYYNPLVDTGSGLDDRTVNDEGASNIVRDRFPVPYKFGMYFESVDYQASKGMLAYGDRGPFSRETPDPNHEDPTLRCLPYSSIKIYKNGKCIGTAFRNLMAFLPPSSNLQKAENGQPSQDDGTLGYYPAISCFTGGVAEVNFGPDFWCPPEDPAEMSNGEVQAKKEPEDAVMGGTEEEKPSRPPPRPLRPMHERYEEQVAEDVLADLVDDADFWWQDGRQEKMDIS